MLARGRRRMAPLRAREQPSSPDPAPVRHRLDGDPHADDVARVVVCSRAMPIQWEGITWGLAATVWLLLAVLPRLAALRLPPEPGPPTLEPGPEPPAVASLLVSGPRARLVAVAATVLDLGARGLLDL